MSNSYGERFRITIFGQSHADAIGVVIEGIPAGVVLDLPEIQAMMARRAPGSAPYATARKEPDLPEIVSGTVNGVTCGAPLCAIIRNKDVRSGDYDALRTVPRPSHADFAAFRKYEGQYDHRGGGRFSGRMTAPLVFAGAVAMQLLQEKGVTVGAHIAQIGHIKPIMHCSLATNGKPIIISKHIGMRKAMSYVVDRLFAEPPDPKHPIYVMYSYNKENALKLAERIRQAGFTIEERQIVPVGATVGAHVGRNACAITYIKKD